jgi:hypothetical protein
MTGLFMREKFWGMSGNNTANSQHKWKVFLQIQITFLFIEHDVTSKRVLFQMRTEAKHRNFKSAPVNQLLSPDIRSRDMNSCLAGQETACLLWYWKVHYCIHREHTTGPYP